MERPDAGVLSARNAAEALAEGLGTSRPARVAVVLGSGLGGLADRLVDRREVPMSDLPGLPATTVAGHGGRFIAGQLDGTDVLLQAGRYHAYEGHPASVVVAPVRIMAALGIETLVLTNAAGGLRPTLVPGDLVLLDDVLNVSFRSPMIGPVVDSEPRFTDLSAPFDLELRREALDAARVLGIDLKRGVYAGGLGPAYETAAEVRMLRRAGADVVGMSTVPEVVVAAARGMRCLGLSLVTNKATGLSSSPLTHEEVVEAGAKAGARTQALVSELLRRIAPATEGPV